MTDPLTTDELYDQLNALINQRETVRHTRPTMVLMANRIAELSVHRGISASVIAREIGTSREIVNRIIRPLLGHLAAGRPFRDQTDEELYDGIRNERTRQATLRRARGMLARRLWDQMQEIAQELHQRGETIDATAERLGVSVSTVHRLRGYQT